MDIHAALEIVKRLRAITRRADKFGHDRTRILEELIYIADLYETQAEQIETEMYAEAN